MERARTFSAHLVFNGLEIHAMRWLDAFKEHSMTHRFTWFVLLIVLVAPTGCGSSITGAPGLLSANAITARSHGNRWMSPSAQGENLLYISDPSLGTLVYSYAPPKYELVGVLTSPRGSGGLCVDSGQDVFIADASGGGHSLVEYTHAGTSPKAILGGAPGPPTSCTVDTTSGNLAAPISASPGQTTQYVSIFKKAQGKPRNLKLPSTAGYVGYCAYDSSGDLFIATSIYTDSISQLELLELPEGSDKFVTISLDESVAGFGAVFWDGQYLLAADPSKAMIYQFSMAGTTGTTVGKVPLSKSYQIGGFFIDNDKLIDPDLTRPSGAGIVNIYNYPSGGKITGSITGVNLPTSVVISLAGQRRRHRVPPGR